MSPVGLVPAMIHHVAGLQGLDQDRGPKDSDDTGDLVLRSLRHARPSRGPRAACSPGRARHRPVNFLNTLRKLRTAPC